MNQSLSLFFFFSGHVRFIDYEYSSYNYQAFDIGNHFNEFAGEQHKKKISFIKNDALGTDLHYPSVCVHQA